jgi:hypothetical protein
LTAQQGPAALAMLVHPPRVEDGIHRSPAIRRRCGVELNAASAAKTSSMPRKAKRSSREPVSIECMDGHHVIDDELDIVQGKAQNNGSILVCL